jgi:hypothetical protein
MLRYTFFRNAAELFCPGAATFTFLTNNKRGPKAKIRRDTPAWMPAVTNSWSLRGAQTPKAKNGMDAVFRPRKG